MSREYSRSHQGLVTLIIDSYDKAKLSVPKWPQNRTPKKSLYEELRRSLGCVSGVVFMIVLYVSFPSNMG